MKKEIKDTDATISLQELCDHANNNPYSVKEDLNLGYEFITFSENAPKNTREIFSWDDTHVMINDGTKWKIEKRCKTCGEATFHCNHAENPLTKQELINIYDDSPIAMRAGTALANDSVFIVQDKKDKNLFVGAITDMNDRYIAIAQMNYEQYSACWDECKEEGAREGNAERWHIMAKHIRRLN